MKAATCMGAALTFVAVLLNGTSMVQAQDQAKPNILFIMGDDIGWMQPSIYHRGLMVGETPNIDRLGQARDTFYYYSGKDPSAVRYKNWKMYFATVSDAPAGFIVGVLPYGWTQVVNIKRDPFKTEIGEQAKTLVGMGGALAGPATAYVYDWNMLPIGQALWLKELKSYIDFPPMQDPASYNPKQVIQQVRQMKAISHAGQ